MSQRQEIEHHSAEQIAGYLASAIALADTAGLTDEDRAVCLPALLNLFAAKTIQMVQVQALDPAMAKLLQASKR